MYDTDQLIDRIRELEEGITYCLVVSGSNMDGEPFGWVQEVYLDIDSVPDSLDDIAKAIIEKSDYEMYVDNYSDCCGNDPDCCGETKSLNQYMSSHVKVSGVYKDRSVREVLAAQTGDEPHVFLGYANNDYEECSYEIKIQGKRPK